MCDWSGPLSGQVPVCECVRYLFLECPISFTTVMVPTQVLAVRGLKEELLGKFTTSNKNKDANPWKGRSRPEEPT